MTLSVAVCSRKGLHSNAIQYLLDTEQYQLQILQDALNHFLDCSLKKERNFLIGKLKLYIPLLKFFISETYQMLCNKN